MKPNEVDSSNEQLLLKTVYNYKRLESSSFSSKPIESFNGKLLKLKKREAKFKIGDFVRLSKYRVEFDKGYTPNWSTEIFKIRKIQYNTDPITYLLSDYQNQDIKGAIYAEELQRVMHPDIYLVEKTIRRGDKKRKGQVYVKWLGFGPEHNSWIYEKNIL